jgi:hypothetical protein
MDLFKELWSFMRSRKKLWLLPLITFILILAGVLFITSGTAVAPFLYTLF